MVRDGSKNGESKGEDLSIGTVLVEGYLMLKLAQL